MINEYNYKYNNICYDIYKERGVFLRANNDIRAAAKQKGVKHWEIADKLGIIDSNFSRNLRHELSDKQKQQIFAIIDAIAAAKTNTEIEKAVD